MRNVSFHFAQLRYELGSRLLFLPGLVATGMGLVALGLEHLETARIVELGLGPIEPATAQSILATLAGSTMTLVSVVYSVLLVALSLASTQFSTRILAGMVRDRFAHVALGLFLGTFVWLLVALRAVHVDPPWVPPLTTSLAVALAVASLFALVAFIDRIIQGLQANHIVARIATETEAILDDVFPPADGAASIEPPAHETSDEPARQVVSRASGYVQLVDVEGLCLLARGQGVHVRLLRPMGSFVAEGLPLFEVRSSKACTSEVEDALVDAVDLGEFRTMQKDAEWGLRQIVDIGLKAISPAVNDPSTGALCIDHLSRLLVRAARRAAPRTHFVEGSGSVVVPSTSLADLVDLAFEQLRQYGKSDMAIALRLMRAIGDVAECTTDAAARARLLAHARAVDAAAKSAFDAADRIELEARAVRAFAALDPNGYASGSAVSR
jgi:uncharacterized membrane protein